MILAILESNDIKTKQLKSNTAVSARYVSAGSSLLVQVLIKYSLAAIDQV